ncbi:MAG: hypothetical protein A3C58_00675 [Candidatus Staskawiczbacteria bacterium RIFCSPHIGHO2_02_FULL_34_10]|uniref:Uncharacterized protein n=1 Tax=Candidatus Staskawiczbacteria bacterium RIFCSPHIGHO2_02_FULL_34_10 TaxID=1802205 RepID=A0A1G2HUE1_9BACT|nr:MAG: hypothetical protein A3C58_00675 [Candidatus Staskawiczbacteria bacterium RIFCSPHIGHO2_02_FULL_34_10]
MVKVFQRGQIVIDREYLKQLQRKALLFEEVLSFFEDKYFGFLMEETEKEETIPLAQAKKRLR